MLSTESDRKIRTSITSSNSSSKAAVISNIISYYPRMNMKAIEIYNL
jgi:hypothetical protein